MPRKILRDDQYARIEEMLPGKATDVGVTAKDNRVFVEAVLWIARTGSPWRDLPASFGPWNSAYKRFARWSERGVWHRVFAELAKEADFELRRSSSTPPSSEPTSMLPVLPKKWRSSDRALAGRTDHQDSQPGRGAGQSGAMGVDGWASARSDAGGDAAGGHQDRGCDRR